MTFVNSTEMKIELAPEQAEMLSTKETIKIIIRDNPDTVMAFDIMDEDKLIGFVLVHRFWLKGIKYGRIPYSDRGG